MFNAPGAGENAGRKGLGSVPALFSMWPKKCGSMRIVGEFSEQGPALSACRRHSAHRVWP